ncbi:FAD/NAD(P)-binding domain-containing protein [Annulohypoxylon maeteangense]|uniref:FAD/NAD(P)-binding domain-containing protein n=1 Tax=Annulohypoxylon maeteangense TaxID=1927788 RepID=UPI00200897B1|nr:FAD/NAD(P)-binding domain-containing protein [Annulohypoxylon maeteangense]KAI0888537.1 FAD/NAD(P)-binding domain-containing protein [Annulohypoxylon maeteangense]
MGNLEPFKVIIAGGGVAGLALANTLQKADIDFVVLENRDVAPKIGASICLISNTGKIFDQLGVWKTICALNPPLTNRYHVDERGRLFDDSPMFREAMEQTGRPILFMERHFCLKTLYDNIEDQSKVRENTGVVSFSEDEGGVTVLTSSGENIRGSILVAADGVHSTIRRLIAESVAESDPERSQNLIRPYTSSYRTVFGTSPSRPEADAQASDGVVYHVYSRNRSGITTPGPKGLIFWFLFIKEETTYTTPDVPRYTESDAAASVEKYGDLTACPGYLFRDLWNTRVKGGMVTLEEGVVRGAWNNGGRVVLVGDATCKTTINGGIGGNLAVEGICNLANELVSLVRGTPTPTTQNITDSFERYEQKQRPRAEIAYMSSNMATRYEAMDTPWLRFLRWLSSWIRLGSETKAIMGYMGPAPFLNFLPDPDVDGASLPSN